MGVYLSNRFDINVWQLNYPFSGKHEKQIDKHKFSGSKIFFLSALSTPQSLNDVFPKKKLILLGKKGKSFMININVDQSPALKKPSTSNNRLYTSLASLLWEFV